MATTFEEFVAKERERLIKARDDATAKKKAAEEELLAIEREMAAIAAYEQVKTGKSLQIGTTKRAPRAAGSQRAAAVRNELKFSTCIKEMWKGTHVAS